MENPSPAEILYQSVRSELADSTAVDEVERQVQAVACSVGIAEEIVTEVIGRFRAELTDSERAILPRLLVDWGEPPGVGHQARPEFSLLCPQYSARPDITITVDRDLDHDPDDPSRRPQAEDSGLWAFHVPFRMTSGGMDCRPGHYLIDVRVSFRDISTELPRFFRCCIRLNVPDTSEGQAGVLEIDGDGQSMVNLHGYNLKQFSKVILKGGEDSVINLQDAAGTSESSGSDATDAPATTFRYQLKIDTERQSRLPVLVVGTRPRTYLDACRFDFTDGRRVQIIARPRLTFGRSRDNDVVLRFLPASEEHNQLSRIISRTHFISELTADGIELLDQSRSGLEINYSVVRDRHLTPASFAGDPVPVSVGVTGTVTQQFDLEMTLFGPETRELKDEIEYWDEVYCDVLGGRLARTARAALDARINAVRFERTNNLDGQETYVHLLREALIGRSPAQSAVVLQHGGSLPQARLLHIDRSFWIERITGADSLSVDGQDLQPRAVIPLAPGATVDFSGESATFERSGQLHLT